MFMKVDISHSLLSKIRQNERTASFLVIKSVYNVKFDLKEEQVISQASCLTVHTKATL